MASRTETMIRVAELYYEQNLSQNEIAGMLGVSRPTVSRLLDDARSAGIVEIKINNPVRKNAELSIRLRERFKLKDALIIRGEYNHEKALQRCAEAATHFFYSILESNMNVGIIWGEALSNVCDAIERIPNDLPCYNVTVVQMVGCLGTGDPNVDGIELALRISKALHGHYANIYSPVFVNSDIVYEYLVKEPQIESTLKQAENLDIVLTGIGAFDSTTILQRAGYITDNVRNDLISNGAVGHIIGRPFDSKGNEVKTDGLLTVGASLSSLHHTPWTIGIAASEMKAEPVLAAIRGGYVNVLVADEPLANRLLEISE